MNVTTDGTVISFEDRLRAKLAAEGRDLDSVTLPGAKHKDEKPKATALGFDFEDDIPTADDISLSEDELEIDRAIETLDIVDAFNRWSGKPKINPPAGQRESIKASCPDPNHRDSDPSMWMNRDKNVYYCSGCEYGGDVFDIAAFHFGYSVPHYKTMADEFRDLREKMAADLGFSVTKGITGGTVYTVSEEEYSRSRAAELDNEDSKIALHPAGAAAEAEDDEYREDYVYSGPTIDWQDIVPHQTFLREWMEETTRDNCPEEYHFWTGLMALGYAVGRQVVLDDAPEVVANLFVCLTGPSSTGKSKAKRHLKSAVLAALPYSETDPFSQGVKMVGAPGSGEYLVKAFSKPITDPAVPGKTVGMAPVRGYIDFEEFATLAQSSSRQGSTLKPQLLDIYDAQPTIVGGSLTHGSREAQRPFGQVISSTQPNFMSEVLSKKDDVAGFVNRWVFAVGKPKPLIAWGGVKVDLTRPINTLKSVHMWGSTNKTVMMSPEAIEAWSDFFFTTMHPLKVTSEKRGSAILGRIDLLMKKLILIFCINEKTLTVQPRHVEMAIKLFPYLVGSFGNTEKKINRTDDGDLEQLVLAQITKLTKKNKIPPTKRDIYLSCKSRIKTLDQVARVLKNMVAMELIVETAYKPKTGRPTVRYSVGGVE